ncbi:MAG: holo-ACP synthase, partial [Candidatus Puniceispirillaceae bacterium]
AERSEAARRGQASLYFAKRFAAKEAVYKALSGSGINGMGWRDAEIATRAGGAPELLLSGRCKTALERLTPDGYNAAVSLSLSDEPPYAVAFVVISAQTKLI